MLLRFNVTNFKSFQDKQELTMISDNRLRSHNDHILKLDKNVNILRLAVIYGANASGKSNFVDAIRFSKQVITRKLPNDSQFFYNKIDIKNREKETKFEYEFYEEGKYYAYGFGVYLFTGKFSFEYLYELNPINENQVVIFERQNLNDICEISIGEDLKLNELDKERLNIYINDFKTNSNQLFLKEMNRGKKITTDSGLYIFKKVFQWFRRTIETNFPDEPMTYFDYLNEDKGIEKINEIIGLFDTGIIQAETKDVSIDELKEIVPENLYQKLMDDLKNKVEEKEGNEEVSFTLRGPKAFYRIKANKENFMNPFVRTIVFVHDFFNRAKFSLDEESDGTIRLFELLEILLSDEEDKIYVIDEMERSLHPNLTYSFIEKYICQLEKRNIQLIFTTHESTIMDQDLLRRDEVWFVDKNSNNNSILYSLDKFNQRIDKKLDKAYLDGRYGGVPIISKCNNKVN